MSVLSAPTLRRAPLRLSVVVPSYQRPLELSRCLSSLTEQERAPDEIMVVRRSDDTRAAQVAHAFEAGVSDTAVDDTGLLAALRAGATRATGDVIAFIDDDAVARPDWLARIESWMADATIGAIGGRDVVRRPERPADEVIDGRLTTDVGRITWFGSMIGNHHRGCGPARPALVLKGVNLAFRREALALPDGLHGRGAVVHWEVASCLWAVRQGWRLIYDPAVIVDHFPATRPAGDRRIRPDGLAVKDASYNYAMALLSARPELFVRRALYGLGVGDRAMPGLLRAVVGLVSGDSELVRKFWRSVQGQAEAHVDIARGRRLLMIPTPTASADVPTAR